MARDIGYMYLLAIGPESSEILEGTHAKLRDASFSALETSEDGKLGYIRIPTEVSRLTIPSGTAVRVPTLLGCHLAQNKQWRVLTSEEFYRRGYVQPDPYALLEEVEKLEAAAEEVAKEAEKLKAAEKEVEKLKEEVKQLRAEASEPEVAKPEEAKPTTSPRTRGKSK